MSQTLQSRITHAHYLGKNLARHKEAELDLLAIADNTDDWIIRAQCYQQAGVYASNDGRHEDSVEHFGLARECAVEANDPVLLGSIARDKARSAAALGRFEQAFALLREAFDRHQGNTRELMMDEAFYGRLICQKGLKDRDKSALVKGIFHMETADRGFRELAKQGDSDAGNLELDNMLHLSYWLSRSGQRRKSRHLASLANVLLNMGFGNPGHRIRARLLGQPGIGGWWLEDLAKFIRGKRRQPARRK